MPEQYGVLHLLNRGAAADFAARSAQDFSADLSSGEAFAAAANRLTAGDPADLLVNAGRAVIGTPEDAVRMIERLQEKQGEFGVMLFQAHNWADWEETKKSYELYARFVMPHFAGTNRNKQFVNNFGVPGALTNDVTEQSSSVELYGENWFYVVPTLSFVTGVLGFVVGLSAGASAPETLVDEVRR